VEKSSSRTTWVRIKRAVRKSIKFFPSCINGPPDGSVRDRDDYARCCTSFQKLCFGRRRRFRLFICCVPCRRFDAKPRLFEWASNSCSVSPPLPPPFSPGYTPYCPYASTELFFPFCRSFCSVTIVSSEHSMPPCSTTQAPNGSGSSLTTFQPLAILALT
jgi:hypothetical protein